MQLNVNYPNCTPCVPYSGKVWQGESLANLVNHPWFAKLKPSKFLLTVITFWLNLFICQTFFAKCSKWVNSPNFSPAKLSHYTIYLVWIIIWRNGQFLLVNENQENYLLCYNNFCWDSERLFKLILVFQDVHYIKMFCKYLDDPIQVIYKTLKYNYEPLLWFMIFRKRMLLKMNNI